jgi:uncharacterized protein
MPTLARHVGRMASLPTRRRRASLLRVQTPLFVVRVADLERGRRRLDAEIPVSWLTCALSESEATATSSGWVKVELSITDTQVMVRGHAGAEVTMPCAKTLEPVPVILEAEIFLMLDPAPSAQRHARTRRTQQPTSVRGTREPGVAAGSAVKPEKMVRVPESELTDSEAGRDTYHGEQIVLDPFLREFLLLELPIAPVRSDLRAEPRPAIPATLAEAVGAAERALDPRLRPLVEIANRLSKKTKE